MSNTKITKTEQSLYEVEMIEVKPEPLDPFEDVAPPPAPAEPPQDTIEPRVPRRKAVFERCQFCFQLLQADQRVHFDASGQLKLEKKIEFVLSTDLDGTPNVNCCASCWHMFEMFYRFKKSCLIALHKQDELVMFDIPIDGIKTDIRVTSRGSDAPLPVVPEAAQREIPRGQRKPVTISNPEPNPQPPSAEPADEPCYERYPCSQCHRSFSTANGLQAHGRRCKILKDRVYRCNLCPAVFKVPNALKWHLNIHSGAKPYACRLDNCGKKFKNPANRWEHEQNCMKNSHLRCKICKKQLRKGSSIAKHMRRHHKNENVRRFNNADEDDADESGPFGLTNMGAASGADEADWGSSLTEPMNFNQVE